MVFLGFTFPNQEKKIKHKFKNKWPYLFLEQRLWKI